MTDSKLRVTVRVPVSIAAQVLHWAEVLDTTPAKFLAMTVERWEQAQGVEGADSAPHKPHD